jgi:hypothetical protein
LALINERWVTDLELAGDPLAQWLNPPGTSHEDIMAMLEDDKRSRQ